ncbi:hypothetical protein [Virgibacillus sp. SK37]|uniref:hypothetical protein n=1 Tax=Virgibacillus sp. SK37 TaxID=403957 RepID=UPI0004D165E3|nr:hypothetical protein [Virgibacillus sp. SK37]AIF45387.1 hypothetical protein X953_09575 [Virgibacillus sp. SK37]
MVRSIIVLLLFAIFFLTGTLYGMDHAQPMAGKEEGEVQTNKVESKEIKNEKEPKKQKEESQDPIVVSAENVDVAEPVSFVQKTAALLEAVVKGFYEVLVQLLYQVSKLFF